MTRPPHGAPSTDADLGPFTDNAHKGVSDSVEARMSDRSSKGRAIYARNFEVNEAEASRLMTDRVGAQYTHEVFEVAGGQGWQSSSLTDRDRSIAVIAALVSQQVVDERLSTYLSLARRNGLDQQGLTTLMVLLTAYVGQPYASAAMAAVHASAHLESNVTADRGRVPRDGRQLRHGVTGG